MPAGLAAALPGANVPRNGSKSAGNNDSEAAAKRRKDDQLEEARTKSNIIVKGTAATAAAASSNTTTAASAQPSPGIAGSALASLLGARSNVAPGVFDFHFAFHMG